MTIFLTTAANKSKYSDGHLLPKFFRGIGTPAPIKHGDFAFFGLWTGGERVGICGDRKRLPDLVQCINDHRHMEQIRAAKDGGYRFQFVVLQDVWRSRADGVAEYKRGSRWKSTDMETTRIDQYLFQLSFYLNIPVIRTVTTKETAERVIHLYHMFQRPPEEHTSLEGIYEPPLARPDLYSRPTLKQEIAFKLPGVGETRSLAASEHFKSVVEMVNAPKEEWLGLHGFGENTVEKLYADLRREE